jgi:hypothetical protein
MTARNLEDVLAELREAEQNEPATQPEDSLSFHGGKTWKETQGQVELLRETAKRIKRPIVMAKSPYKPMSLDELKQMCSHHRGKVVFSAPGRATAVFPSIKHAQTFLVAARRSGLKANRVGAEVRLEKNE